MQQPFLLFPQYLIDKIWFDRTEERWRWRREQLSSLALIPMKSVFRSLFETNRSFDDEVLIITDSTVRHFSARVLHLVYSYWSLSRWLDCNSPLIVHFSEITAERSRSSLSNKGPLRTEGENGAAGGTKIITEQDDDDDVDGAIKPSDHGNRLPDNKDDRDKTPEKRKPADPARDDDGDNTSIKKKKTKKKRKYRKKRKHWKKHRACRTYGKYYRRCQKYRKQPYRRRHRRLKS